jgi:hypothetical protein
MGSRAIHCWPIGSASTTARRAAAGRHAVDVDADPGVVLGDATRPGEDPWASELAEWHLQTQSTPHDAGVLAAYRQLEEQTDGLFRSLTDRASRHPVTVSFTFLRQPYDSDQELISAIVYERRLEVSVAAIDRHRLHPVFDCRPGGPYDRFRAVHDIVGHGFGQRGFDAEGEYSAWSIQNCQYRGLARLALATELRAENAVLRKTGEFAEHKALILPRALSRTIK